LCLGKESAYEGKDARFYKAVRSRKEHKIIHEEKWYGNGWRRKREVLGG